MKSFFIAGLSAGKIARKSQAFQGWRPPARARVFGPPGPAISASFANCLRSIASRLKGGMEFHHHVQWDRPSAPPTDAAQVPCRHTRRRAGGFPAPSGCRECRYRRWRPAAPTHDARRSLLPPRPAARFLNGSTLLPSLDVPSGNSTTRVRPAINRPRISSRASAAWLRRWRVTNTERCSRARVPKKGQLLTSDLATKESGITAEKITISIQPV